MLDWLRSKERRKDHRRRFEVERDQRIQRELAEGVAQREQRERRLIDEMRRLERVLARVEQ